MALPFGSRDIDPSVLGSVTFSGYTTACTAPDGSIDGSGRAGLYDYDTRILSRYRLLIDGSPPDLVSSTRPDSSRRVITLRRAVEGGTPDGPALPQDALEITVSRRVGRGMLDQIDVLNHSMAEHSAELTLEVDADFEEIVARRSDRRVVGDVKVHWDQDGQVLQFDFEARTGER